MVIYEVNLTVNCDVYTEFKLWLKQHAQEMLQFPGFIQAFLLEPEKDTESSQEHITVQYQLESKEALDTYLNEFAPKMRGEGSNLFKDRFSASRKIFKVQEILNK